MEPLDLKTIKRLADMCRKAGITHFKNDKFEFTLGDAPPERAAKKANEAPQPAPNVPFQSDTLTDDELLYWSVGSPADKMASEES